MKDALRTKVVVSLDLELGRGRHSNEWPGSEEGQAVGVPRTAEAEAGRTTGLAVRPCVGARVGLDRSRLVPVGGVQDLFRGRQAGAGDKDKQDGEGEASTFHARFRRPETWRVQLSSRATTNGAWIE